MTDQLDAFWLLDPQPASADPVEPDPAVDRLGRPDITIGGRNLADLLRPVYTALTAPVP